jgi:hypothetical protein
MALIEQNRRLIDEVADTVPHVASYQIKKLLRCPGSTYTDFCDKKCQDCEFPDLVTKRAQEKDRCVLLCPIAVFQLFGK